MAKNTYQSPLRLTPFAWRRVLSICIRVLSIPLGVVVFAHTAGMSVGQLWVLSDYHGPGIAVLALSIGFLTGIGIVAHCFRIAADILPEP